MSTRTPEFAQPPQHIGSGPAKPGATVLGWLIVCIAIIPLSMAAHGEGRLPVVAGLAMLGFGLTLIVGSRLLKRRDRSPGPKAPAV